MNRLKPFAGVGVLLFAVLILAHAQWNAQEPPLNLPLVSPQELPECGTFWLYSGSGEDGAMPPWPFDPYGGVMPVYALPNLPGQFLIADTKEDYAEWQALQFSLRQAELSGGLMSMNSLEFPGEGDTNGGGGGTWEYTPIVYGSNDLWLELVAGSVTNGTADLIIHNPEDIITNSPVWDLYATTNLSLDTPGLNATNWVWLLRTDPGQTNVTAPALSDFQCYYRLGDTNDTDGDGLTDAFEALVSHSNALTNDTDGDGLFDDWSWRYFGSVIGSASAKTRAEDDYDNDGVVNWIEQLYGTDPNDLCFTAFVGYGQVSVTNPLGTITLLGGVPAELAVLVDSTNFASANWQLYTGTPVVPLPSVEGPHQVWVALRARVPAESPAWQGFTVNLDQTPPQFTLTSPTGSLVHQPVVQLTGWSTDNLWSLGCNLSNAAGLQSNLTGCVTGKTRGAATTNHFQCFDLELTNGVNEITLQVMDLAGNSTFTNLSVVYDLSGDTIAPLLTPLWPRAGMKLGGSQFTLRARVDDPTATVTLQTLSTNGVTNVYSGLMERNGAVWVEDVPLNSGTNWLTLTAVDAATNSVTTNFLIVKSSVTATINEPVDLTLPYTTVTGTIGQSGYDVWVNGIQAIVQGGTWEAVGVSVPEGGTGTIALELVPDENNGEGNIGGDDPSENNPNDPDGVQFSIQPEKPAVVTLLHGRWEEGVDSWGSVYDETHGWGALTYQQQRHWNWNEATGGSAELSGSLTYPEWTFVFTPDWWHSTYAKTPSGAETLTLEYGFAGETYTDTNAAAIKQNYWGGDFPAQWQAQGEQHWRGATNTATTTENWHQWTRADVDMELDTGGRGPLQGWNLIRMEASASTIEAPYWGGGEPIAAPAIHIPRFGALRTDGTRDKPQAINTKLLVTPQTPAPLARHEQNAVGLGITLEGVTFAGAGSRSVLNDTTGDPYPTPHWTNAPGATNYPVLYESGRKVEALASLRLQPGSVGGVVHVRGLASAGTNSFTLWASNHVAGGPVSVATAVADTALANNRVDYLNPLSIQWSYCLTNAPEEYHPLVTSANPVYVTYSPPLATNILFHTVVHLACKTPGGNSPRSVFDNTWTNFSTTGGPADVMTWDEETKLYYYKPGLPFADAKTTAIEMLSDTNRNGQCGAWAQLFQWALFANGRGSSLLKTIYPPLGVGYLVVSNWNFGETNVADPVFQWEDEITKNAEGNPEMVPLNGVTGPVEPASGVKGQNSPTPAEKIFSLHQVVYDQYYPWGYYDPSYGKVYTGAADFESQAIAGYARQSQNLSTNPATIKIEICKTNSTVGLPQLSP